MTRLMTLAAGLILAAGCSRPAGLAFRRHDINPQSRVESASVFDVNRDGQLDIYSGDAWYEAPTWARHPTREVRQQDDYHYNFSDLPADVDADGWIDTITCAWHDKSLSWVRNPGSAGGTWETILIDQPGNVETAILADVNADGRPDVIPCVYNGRVAWYAFRPDPASPHGVRWDKHELPEPLSDGGLGTADLNGDGRLDIIGGKGWAEQPGDSAAAWIWHGEFELPDASVPVVAADVDDDGDLDVVWGTGHNYGVHWHEQERDALGQRTWARHEIDRSFSQAHVILTGDLDGDGRAEFVTGKRFWAHNGHDPGEREPRCLYAYGFDPGSRTWTRRVIEENGPAGIGLSTELVDIDRDGDLDLVTPGKSGLYLFENLSTR